MIRLSSSVVLIAFIACGLVGPTAAQQPLPPGAGVLIDKQDAPDTPRRATHAQGTAAPTLQAGNALVTRAAAGLTDVGEGSSSVADVDGDGHQDVLITGVTANGPSATLYLGEGNGDFTAAGADLMGVRRSASSIADVNDNGHMDLLVTGRDANRNPTATLYLGNGDGTFSEAGADLTGVFDSSTSIADVDDDGHQDLLITGTDASGTPTATLYLGNGDGTFSEANAGLTGVQFGDIAIAGLDEDGNQDLLITGADANFDGVATLYLGNGDGTFSEANANLDSVAYSATSVADVNGDDHLDLLIAGTTGVFEPQITLYLGNGDGTFSTAGTDLIGVGNGATAITDVDGDETLDLLVTGFDENRERSARLYLGNGDATFSEANAGLTGVAGSSVAVADVGSDGDNDLFITGADAFFTETPSTRLYVNRTQQTPPNRSPRFAHTFADDTLAAGLTQTRRIEAGDPDGDSISVQLAQGTNVSVSDNGNGTATVTLSPDRAQIGQAIDVQIEVVDSEGTVESFSATLAVPSVVATFSTDLASGGSPSMGDVNGDGALDLFVGITVYQGDEQGGFTGSDTLSVAGASAMADVDTDGNLDVLVAGRDMEFNPSTTLYLGNGDGTFSATNADLADLTRSSVSVADVDADGHLDVLLTGRDANDTPSTRLYLGNGDGTFSSADAGLRDLDGATSIADVNNDGSLDLLITGEGTSGARNTNLYLGTGDGAFNNVPNPGLVHVVESATSVADVNEDGNPDLLISGGSDTGPTTTLYLGNGDGTFSEANAGLVGVRSGATALSDVDGDGTQDVLIAGFDPSFDETTALYVGNGDGTFAPANAGLRGIGGIGGLSTALGDVDNDGHPDLLTTGGETLLYENLAEGDRRAAVASKTVTGDGSQPFGDTGVRIRFFGVGGSGPLTVQKFGNAPPGGPQGVADSTVSEYRFVISAGGDLTFADTTEVRLDVGALGGIGDASTVTLYRRSPRGTGRFDSLATSFDAQNNELVATTRGFSEFVLASDDPANALPVELAGFEAQIDGDAVRLSWSTASETGNARFEVQRRVGEGANGRGRGWTTVGSVEGAGTTTEAQSYRFVDERLPYEADRLDYRLRQVDTDGSAQFSETVTVERRVSEVQLLGTAPNPAGQRATVRYALPAKQDVTVRLYDVLGRQVRTVVSGAQEGRHQRTLDVGSLPSGVYFLRLRAGGETRTQKLTVVR